MSLNVLVLNTLTAAKLVQLAVKYGPLIMVILVGMQMGFCVWGRCDSSEEPRVLHVV